MSLQEPARSPARHPQLPDRSSSSQSLSKGSPSAGHLSNTHKGSYARLHKAHPVGHGRHGHNRVSSQGKGLNKLSKLGPGNTAEDPGHIKPHIRSASHSPSSSPNKSNHKRNSSAISLNRPSSKGSMKRNASHGTLSRIGSTAKLGNQSKSEKAQIRSYLLKHGTDDAPLRGTAKFEVGDEAQDDDWTEESSSQSPETTRTGSRPKTPVTPVPNEPPTPDEPPERRSPRLPVSPPESPRLKGPSIREPKTRPQATEIHQHKDSYSHPPDAEAVTNRLLNRNGPHIPAAQTTNVSANITPHHVGSPKLSHSQASTIINEPSMPADGISRFLSGTNSNSGSGTPGSVFNLQNNLTSLERNHRLPSSPTDQPTAKKADARRVKSAANLTHKRLSHGENTSPPKPPQIHQESRKELRPSSQTKQPYLPSPFESARGADPAAGKSLTQLKLNLDREAASRDPPITTHPLLMNPGSMLNTAGTISINAEDIEKRLRRQYAQAQKDVGSCRKYYPDIITGKIPEKAIKRHQKDKYRERRGREKVTKDSGSGGGSSAETAKTRGALSGSSEGTQGPGRVRFEIGSRSFEDGPEGRGDEDGIGDDGLEGLLRRMWIAAEHREEEEGE
ncbi:MAG: hypothetical protein Q9217_002013 [Psora testacea]